MAIEGPRYNTLTLGAISERHLKTPALKFDHAYGIKPVQGSTNFKIGETEVQIEGNDLIVDDNRFEGTEDVWKLLTLKDPGAIGDYSDDDVKIYSKLLSITKPFLREDGMLPKANRGLKWKNIMKDLYTAYSRSSIRDKIILIRAVQRRLSRCDRTRSESDYPSGSGVIFLPSDPNELVQRHKLLFGSYNAGNTGVFNELQAIIDKLLSADIFDKDLGMKLNTVINNAYPQ